MTVDGEKIIVQWYKVCLDWFVMGICWILNLDSFTLHHYTAFGVAFFDDGALDDITNVSSFIMNLSGTCRLKQFLFKSLCNKSMHEHEQLKILICLEGQPCTCGDFWCMGKQKVHASCWKGFRSLLINHEYNLVKLPPKKKCLLVLTCIFKSKHSSFISQGKPSSQTPQFRWWLRCWMCSVATCPKHVPKSVIQLMFCSQGGDPLTDAWN